MTVEVVGKVQDIGEVDDGDMVNHSKLIHGHSFTIGWLLNSLRENDDIYKKLYSNRPVKDITAYDVSGGKGFVSIVLRCTIIFVDSANSNDCYTTILKIPGFESFEEANSKSDFDHDLMNEMTRKKFIQMHEFECDFYSKLAPLIKAPAPKVYKVEDWILDKKEGCLHMEDLTLRGKTLSFFENISLTQVKSYIQHLARMHKNILSVDEKIWKGKFLKNQDGFVEFIEFMSQSYEPFLKSCKREEEFRPLIEKYTKLSDSKDFYLYVNKQSYKDLKIVPVIAQGDMHPGNIMWGIDKNGDIKQELAAIIDWQTMHEGSPMEDLARFLTHCADGVNLMEIPAKFRIL
uniref:CHK kinase-like domain-containing protein n=1 Tax=Panagrolaimus superbus TaxID=310955 RepID=A0A914Z4L3_9BILA